MQTYCEGKEGSDESVMSVYFSPDDYMEATTYEQVRQNLGLVLYSKEEAAASEREADAVFVKEELPGGIFAFLEVLMQDKEGDFYHAPVDTGQVVSETLDIQELIFDGIDCMSEKLPAVFVNTLDANRNLATYGDQKFYMLHTEAPFGASAILFPGVLKNIGERFGCNYFILPSNRDMMIITPDDRSKDLDSLERTLIEQNEKLASEQRLSNSVLYYDIVHGRLMTAREAKSNNVTYINEISNDYVN